MEQARAKDKPDGSLRLQPSGIFHTLSSPCPLPPLNLHFHFLLPLIIHLAHQFHGVFADPSQIIRLLALFPALLACDDKYRPRSPSILREILTSLCKMMKMVTPQTCASVICFSICSVPISLVFISEIADIRILRIGERRGNFLFSPWPFNE